MNKFKELTKFPYIWGEYKSNLSNLYLNMYKYGSIGVKKDGRNNIYKIESIIDKKFKNNIMKCYKSDSFEKELLNKIHKQMNLIIKAYESKVNESNVIKFKFQVENRIIIGNSGGNYGNISILALHPTYCIPYIPSSAIKGAFRSYMIYTKYNGDESAAMKCEDFIKLFGSSDNGDEDEGKGIKGGVIFLDAFPEDEFVIEQDVQTVHYQKYYEGKSEPTDDLNKIPINMYAVGKTAFIIYAVFKKGVFNQNQIKEFEEYFKETFTEFGIGAKTSIGYGLGKIIS